MTTTNEAHLIRSNRKFAKCFDDGDLSHLPAKKYAIVTCMDCRIDAYSAFGITPGDAHVIRNAGGSARDALRSLVISQQLLQTNEVFIIKHTHCGMQGLTNDGVNATVAKNLGPEAVAELDAVNCKRFDWLPFAELKQGVRDDVAFLRSSRAITREVHVSGWVFDVETGKVSRVEK